jgi:hypothetical protein
VQASGQQRIPTEELPNDKTDSSTHGPASASPATPIYYGLAKVKDLGIVNGGSFPPRHKVKRVH